MLAVWHPKRWSIFCMTEDEKKKGNRTNFYRVVCISSIQFESIEMFCHGQLCVKT